MREYQSLFGYGFIILDIRKASITIDFTRLFTLIRRLNRTLVFFSLPDAQWHTLLCVTVKYTFLFH